MRMIVVEPHPDDAYLSLGWHLENLWRDQERWIITVYSNQKRAAEGEAYAGAIGAEYINLGLEEAPMASTSPIRRIEELGQVLKELKVYETDSLLFPLGLQHPDHLRVAATRPGRVLRYLDTPYQMKLKLRDDLQRRAEGMSIYSICFPHKAKWRHIGLFKSQAKFFHFNPLEQYRLPEIVLCQS